MRGHPHHRRGDDRFELGAGGYTLLPRDVPHSFIALEDVTMLGVMSPGGEFVGPPMTLEHE